MLRLAARRWFFERITEILAISVWMFFWQEFYFTQNTLRLNGSLIFIPVMVIWVEFVSLYLITTFLTWLLQVHTYLRPLLIGGLAFAHLWVVAHFPNGEMDLFFGVAIILIFLNALIHLLLWKRIERHSANEAT